MKTHLLLIALSINSLLTHSQTQQSLSFYADKCSINVGAAVGSTFYTNYNTNSTYDLTVKRNFNILVAENEMKFAQIQPTQGNFSFTKSDQLVNYAVANGILLRGHTLCWYSRNPAWIEAGLTNGIANGTFTRATLMAILKNHITTTVTRYKGKIQQWDVVNEAFNDDGSLRTSIWQQVIGNDYIDSAFVWTYRADPTAKLYLNDYSIEYSGSTKSNAILNYVKGMKTRKIPINGVGFQCHFFVNNILYSKIDQNIKAYALIGIEVAITELDVRIKKTDYETDSVTQLARQAENYRQMILLCINNSNCKTMVTWGFTDLYSWIPNYTSNLYDYSLIFDKNYNPKPAYTSMLNELYLGSLSANNSILNDNSTLKVKEIGNKIIINSDKDMVRCQLFDIHGRLLFNSSNSGREIEINLNKIPLSLIVLKVQLPYEQIVVRKIIKQ